MRIALISSSFLPIVGGLEWKVHFLAEEYVRAGHEVTVFAGRPRVAPGPVPMPVTNNYAVVRCGYPVPGIARAGITRRLFVRAIQRACRNAPFDILHSHHLGGPTTCALAVKAITDVPVVATTCGDDIQVVPEINFGLRLERRHDRAIRRNVAAVDALGSISKAIHKELDRIGTPARIVDIPNGVDWDRFQIGRSSFLRGRMGLAEDDIFVLSVGRNRRVKGYAHGISAFAKIAKDDPHCHYALVGRHTTRLAQYVEDLGMAGRVSLIEQLPMKDLPRVYHSADVFFNPSVCEGFAQVNAQALACGLPCVLTDAPGNCDAGDNGGAVIAASGNIESMSGGLKRLIGDSTLRRKLGRQAHRAGRRFAWRQIAAEYLDVFQSLM